MGLGADGRRMGQEGPYGDCQRGDECRAGEEPVRLPGAWGCEMRLEAVGTAPSCGVEKSLHFPERGLRPRTGSMTW